MTSNPKNNYSADVAIIGGGISGIVTALELLDTGKKILLFDRDIEENFGGLAKESFGGMFFVNSPQQRFSKIDDGIDKAIEDWFSFAEFDQDEKWGKLWAKSFIQENHLLYQWLKNKKIKFFPVVHWVERGLDIPGNSVPRFHMVWGTGYGLMEAIISSLKSHPNFKNLSLAFEHFVEDFQLINGEISAIVGKNEETQEDFICHADEFVVATGGINGNIEKVKQYWHKEWNHPPEKILNGSHQYSDGIIHEKVEKIGGNITNLNLMWNYAAGIPHPYPKRENHGLSLVPPKSALWLNYRGERIGPKPLVTAFDTRYLVTKICEQEKQYSWQILNKRIAYKELAVSGAEFNDGIRNKNLFGFLSSLLFGNKKLISSLEKDSPNYIVANSIDELAEKMNALTGTNDVNVDTLNASIKSYDAHFKEGMNILEDEQIRLICKAREYKGDRARTIKPQPLDQKSAYPLIAIREFILSRKSLGGIQTNLQSQVLSIPDKNNNQYAFNNLYAVGEAAGFGGGGSHGKRALEGTFLTTCIFTAQKAAEHMIKKYKK